MRIVVLALAFAGCLVCLQEPVQAQSPSQMPAPASIAQYVDSLIATDARGWLVYHYDRGSVSNVTLLSQSVDGNDYVAQANYTYNNGQNGWAKVKVINRTFSCIEFWDSGGSCRRLRTPLDQDRRNTSPGLQDPFGGGGNCKWWESDQGLGKCV